MLEKFSFYIIPSLITFIGITYIQSKILNKGVNLKSYRVYISLIIFTILSTLNQLYVSGFIKFIINTILITIVSYITYSENINKTFVAVIMEQILYFFGELSLVLIILLLGINLNLILASSVYFIFFNVIIALIAVLIYYIPFVNKSINKLMVFLSNFGVIKKYIISFIFFITLNVFIMLIYFSSDNKNIILINALFILIYSAIIYFLIKEKNDNVKFKQENKMLLDSLNDYEKMLDYQRINNHENKNQLLVIKSMISKNNKKALDYLDEIIDEKRKDDEGLYTYAKIIPEGGLQGLIYQKMLKMKENNIKINLDVDNKLRKVSFDNISSKTNYDLCRVVGIILDNAIEEVMNLKDKEILVYMHKEDNYFVIEVSNKCKNIPDLSKLDEKGYTTKSNGHGYGLSLLKDIVSKNNLIVNERSINKDIFTQIIKIKM